MNSIIFLISLCQLLILSTGHVIQKRITLGSEAVPHSRPYQVHNVMMLLGGDVQICGGALISQNYVLTAAHCFINLKSILQTVVIMGAHNLKHPDKKYQITTNYIVHKDFKHFPKGHTQNDIALIKLEKPIKLSRNIQLISLPKKSQINESFDGALVTEAGWGKTESNQTSDVLIQGSSKITQDEDVCVHPNSLICTWSTDGHAPCIGDSGSPLVYNDTVIGVVSLGFCIATSYYTRVTSFLDWIEKHSDIKISN